MPLTSNYEKAEVPHMGEGKLLSASDNRTKSGGNVVRYFIYYFSFNLNFY